MKAVLLFYLNSLEIVIVLTQTGRPVTECQLTKAGREYAGPLNVTRSGRTCQRWDSDQPHHHNFKNSTLFPEGNAVGAGNKCRNPDIKHNDGVWCYTTDPNTRWEECDVITCGCKTTMAGREYDGPLSVTRSGRTCQHWNSDQPHNSNYKNSTLFPEGNASAAGNKCRNPDKDHSEGVWCYTTDPNTRWEECDVDFCEIVIVLTQTGRPVTECQLTKAGREYAGSLNVTRSGRTCQRWDSDEPHRSNYKHSTLFPEGSAVAAGNKCRNPDIKHNDGVWCYTTDPNKGWEGCDVVTCGCKTTMAGREYDGPLSTTKSGLTCQRWNSDQPHNSSYKNSRLFPEGNAAAAGNKCRNPDKDNKEGVWCYTTDPNTRWEECDVDFCDCKMTKAGYEYGGSERVTKYGRICQRWNSDHPHISNYKNSTLFPEGNAVAADNKCRNPDKDHSEGVWCYTTDPNTRWEECDVTFCGIGCKLTKAGYEYDGLLSVTRTGRTCQRWSSDQPHRNNYKTSALFPEGNAVAAGNKCRNPDRDHNEGVWCYTTDPNKRWEECDVGFCGAECKLTKAGREYAGLLSVTRSGLTCQRWDSDQSHHHNFKNSTLFPEGNASDAGNRCRNPDKDHNEGVWCYTTDPHTRWEECDVDFCDCKLTKAGREYAGPLNVTRSGLECQRWSSDQPHSHRFKNSTLFPEGSAVVAGNKCRNPDMDHYEGVWCYTTDPNTRWEECDVDFCQTQSRPTPPSTTLRARTVGLTSQRPMQESTNERLENASTNIVVIIIPIVGAIAVVCVVIITIIIWKRRLTGFFQSPWRSLVDEGSPSRSKRNQQKKIAANAIYKPSDRFENPDDVNCQQLIEIDDTTKDQSSTDYVTIRDSAAVAYTPADRVRRL